MNQAQLICIGASSLYGIGGVNGGWADILKRELHQEMFGANGSGEIFEVYNLGVPSATLAHMSERLPMVTTIKKPNRATICLLHLGANDAKSVGTVDNYINTPEKYSREVKIFLEKVQALSDHVVCLGLTPVDENRTMPKVSSSGVDGTYFSNERNKLFEDTLAEVAKTVQIDFIPLFEKASKTGWLERYIWVDGLHPNTDGHSWIYEQLKPFVSKIIKEKVQ